ncbi:MAG: TetR/AcrR family transcriptional regulator [Acidobacteria bacterium]|nr:TetR/AcrR family transcriptional regulator [Acidobacteriota bacterium]
MTQLNGRQRLIRAGRRLFAEKGYSGTGVREIAAEAGVSIGLIRTHFGSKAGLREEIDRQVIAQIEELCSRATRHLGTEALEHLIEDAVEWVERERDALLYLRTSLMERTPGSQALLRELLEIMRRFVQINRRRGLLQDGVDEEWAAIYLVIDFLGPAVLEPFSEQEFGMSMYHREMVKRRSAFMNRVSTRGFMKS